MRSIAQELLNVDLSPLDEEQTEDVKHILRALDLIEQRTPLLDVEFKLKKEQMRAIHEVTGPINGIVGYLFILKQEYTSPLTDYQRERVQSIQTKILDLHRQLSQHLLSKPISR